MLVGLVALTACSGHEKAPVGRWIGHMDTAEAMVIAWLEIFPDGSVKVSAPDILGVGELPAERKAALQARLAKKLSEAWPEVASRKMDFDGEVFRKPGGIAPQMEWNPKKREMKLVFYFGLHKSMRIRMQAVSDFSSDPWLRAAL